ncbi:ROK family protein [Brachybacterium sp. FME24]|uniref:ROK family protein n=1 Tax=Brachybacterium sp. FME24 TaxID=2742605 RepID=UPI001869330F|nr:ROK family protein [Brachybacterium sp. FME24]
MGLNVSMSVLRRLNIEALLRHAFTSGTFTAAEAMEATSLTRATVLGLCDELTVAGWIEEAEDSRAAGLSRRGRPARRHRLRAGAGLVIGVDAGRSGYRAMAADLRGAALATARRELDPATVDRELRISTVQELVREVREASASTAPLLVTVIGIPAPVDSHGASPIEVGTFWRLMNSGFPAHLDGPVVVENDANLSALAEHAQHPEVNMATLLVGERIGAGLMVDGHLLHGALGGAGEMRFLEAALQDDIGAEGVASLARRWTLEGLATGRSSPALAAIPADALSAVDVFAAGQAGDELARDVLDRIGERIARIAAILVSLLGVERIVMAGAVASSLEPVLQRTREVLPDIAYAPFPELVASGLGRDVVVRGAIEHAVSRLREDPLALLDPPT